MAYFPFCHNSDKPSTEEEEAQATKPKAAAKKKFVPKVCISISDFISFYYYFPIIISSKIRAACPSSEG